jgi:hypothetical protein
MPNWCANTLTLEHEDPAMIARAKTAFAKGEFLHEFIPVPAELSEAVANASINEEMVAKYGYSSWYDFCVANWGTKWDVGGGDGSLQDIPNGLMLTFDSAWSPPINAYARLIEQGFKVYATYYEPGMAFAGIWEDGMDDYYEYGGMSADEIEQQLPTELDEAYCISEQVAEYEEENEE